MTRETETDSEPSVLASLRAQIPQRPVSFTEALRIAEQQAARLLARFGIRQWPVPETILLELPHLKVEQHHGVPARGCHFWDSDRRTWFIHINGSEPAVRQRFTLLQEYKHIVDHGRYALLYGDGPGGCARAKQAAELFAGSVLVPRPLLKRAWGDGMRQVAELADAFDVSPRAITMRLEQVGLTSPTLRCGRASGKSSASSRSTERYQRIAYPAHPHLEVAPT